MKKIIAFSVLLALLSLAVFAQDGSGWKIGFTAQLTRDFFYSTKASGEAETKQSTSPSEPNDGTYTGKFGDYIKGSSNMFTYTDGRRPDNRLIISLSNSGDHHSVYIDAKLDNTWIAGGPTLMGLLNGGAADWYFQGDTGALEDSFVVFDGKVGTGRYGGFVPVYEFWDDWLQLAGRNFFGVWEYDGFQPSNNMSNTNTNHSPWDAVYAIGATFGGNFRFAVGSTLGSFAKGFDNPVASASSTEAGFMLSGKGIADMISFDLFYAINGEDKNTVVRGTGLWNNLLGAYVGLDMEKLGVSGLGLSVGYTASFKKHEVAQMPDPKDATKWVSYEIADPVWSGIDLKVKFSGIDKLGITFNNNISFASAKGEEQKEPSDTRISSLSGPGYLGKNQNENWFAYDVILGVTYSLTDHLNVTLAFGNLLGVLSRDSEVYVESTKVTTTETAKITTDELRASLHAEYNVGVVTFGLGFNLGLEALSGESETKVSGTSGSRTTSISGSLNTVKFSVPLFFKVAI